MTAMPFKTADPPDDVIPITAFSRAVECIYDCAFDPAGWPQAIREVCAVARCVAGVIGVTDLITNAARLRQTWGFEPASLERMVHYAPDVAEMWRSIPDLHTRPLDEPVVMSRDAPVMLRSGYYIEWVQPQGIIDAISLTVLRQRDRVGEFSLSRHESAGTVTGRDIAIVRLLAPHIRRAVAIGDALDMQAMTVSTFEASLDLIATGVVLIDDDAKIIHANRAGRSMLAIGSPIRSERGALRTCRPETSAALKTAIAKAISDEAAIGSAGIGIPTPQANGEAGLIHVLPLMRGDVQARIAPRASAALFITVAADGVGPPPAVLAALFDLSAAEVRTLERLLAGDTLAEAAHKLGIAITTARTHLAHIFDKTGASRQADLIHLAAKFSSPVGRPGAR
jgi:DNA-binding CsgD family transcriptional regulator